MGYVVGSWQAWDDDQEHQEDQGKYVAVWEKDKAGHWRITLISGNSYEVPKTK